MPAEITPKLIFDVVLKPIEKAGKYDIVRTIKQFISLDFSLCHIN
jgi:hypothetical protein